VLFKPALRRIGLGRKWLLRCVEPEAVSCGNWSIEQLSDSGKNGLKEARVVLHFHFYIN